MADKTYKISFKMSDSTTQAVNFTAPQGPQGAKGDKGATGVGITSITITEVTA